jgi:hypothetical protein
MVLILSDKYQWSLPATTSPRVGRSAEWFKFLRSKSQQEEATNICQIEYCSNVKTELKETGCEDVYWIHLATDRDKWWALVNKVMSFRVS